MDVPDIKKLKAIQEENVRLKRLAADQALKISLLEDVNSKSGKPLSPAPGSAISGRGQEVLCQRGLQRLEFGQISNEISILRVGFFITTPLFVSANPVQVRA